MSKEKSIAIMELALKFIDKLTEEQMDKLLSKKYCFNITSNTSDHENKTTINKFTNEIGILNSLTNKEEAKEYLKGLKLTNEKLIFLGKEMNIKISRSARKENILNKIIDYSVGNKVKTKAIQESILKD